MTQPGTKCVCEGHQHEFDVATNSAAVDLLRRLRDVVIVTRDGTKLNGHRTLLCRDHYFAEMARTRSSTPNQWHTDQPADTVRRHMQRVYFGIDISHPATNGSKDSVDKNNNNNSSSNGTGNRHHQRNISTAHLPTTLRKGSNPRSEVITSSRFTFDQCLVVNEFPLNEAMELDKRLLRHFESTPSGEHNTYLLLDPSLSEEFGSGNSVAVQMFNAFFKFSKLTRDNFYRIAIEQVNMEVFRRFVAAIFYVGTCAHTELSGLPHLNCSANVQRNDRIGKIVRSGRVGPVWLLCFAGTSEREAQYRASLMMQAMGLANLTNQAPVVPKCFDYELDDHKRVVEGTYLLLKSFLKFVANGQRQLPVNSARSSTVAVDTLLSQILFDEHATRFPSHSHRPI